MKKLYEAPEMEVIRFTCQDVITTSGTETGSRGDQSEVNDK